MRSASSGRNFGGTLVASAVCGVRRGCDGTAFLERWGGVCWEDMFVGGKSARVEL